MTEYLQLSKEDAKEEEEGRREGKERREKRREKRRKTFARREEKKVCGSRPKFSKVLNIVIYTVYVHILGH